MSIISLSPSSSGYIEVIVWPVFLFMKWCLGIPFISSISTGYSIIWISSLGIFFFLRSSSRLQVLYSFPPYINLVNFPFIVAPLSAALSLKLLESFMLAVTLWGSWGNLLIPQNQSYIQLIKLGILMNHMHHQQCHKSRHVYF